MLLLAAFVAEKTEVQKKLRFFLRDEKLAKGHITVRVGFELGFSDSEA